MSPTEGGQSAGALSSDQCLKPGMDQCGFPFDTAQPASLTQQAIVDIEGRSHLHQYARYVHGRQGDASIRVEGGGIVDQDCLGVDKTYYRPADRGHEKTMAEFLERFRTLRDRL